MNEKELVRIEQTIGTKLTDPYRQFLFRFGALTFHGESPDNPFIVFTPITKLPRYIASSGKAMFNFFYGSADMGNNYLSLATMIRFFCERMPPEIIPIGDDGGAGQICIGISGNYEGKIYYWDMRDEALDEEDYLEDYGVPRPADALFQNVYLIASDFADFLARLEIRPEM